MKKYYWVVPATAMAAAFGMLISATERGYAPGAGFWALMVIIAFALTLQMAESNI